jgi:6-phosphogluconolactonase
MHQYIYVTLSGEDAITCFSLDRKTGRLTRIYTLQVPGGPAPLALDPAKKFLYVGLRSSYQIASFSFDPPTGKLRPIGTIPLDTDPCFLSTDCTGRFLFSSYHRAGIVAVHTIGADGGVATPPLEWLSTAENAHSIQTDPSNRFAFAPHTGPNFIAQFRFDETNGHLTPNSPPTVRPAQTEEPRHFCFHPNKHIVYVSNERGSSVTAYHFDLTTGCLAAFQTISTLPQQYRGENMCAQIRTTPSGQFLYVSNRGHDSIACFSLEASTGQLTAAGHTLTEKIPRAFTLDVEGRFLFAAGRESGNLASYQVNGQTGELIPLEIYPVGKSPMWVLAATF